MKGFIQIPLLIILLIGTGAGVYLIQQKTHFFPQALNNIQVLNTFLNQKTATSSANQPFTYQLPKTITAATNYSGNPIISAFQILLQRKADQSPTPTASPKTNASPSPTITPTPSSVSTTHPSATPYQSNSSTSTPTPTPNPKPICSISVIPSNTGVAPYQASVCIGNNSNPYQNIGQEFVDYNGDNTWDYQGLFYGCHLYTFQNPGNYYPRAKIVGTSGVESDICETSAIISAANPTPSPSPTPASSPTPSPSTSSCSQGSLGMFIKFQDITANGPTLKYVNLSLKQPGTSTELWRFDGVAASNNVSTFFNYTQGDMYRIGIGNVACGTYDIYVSSSGYQEKNFPNIVVDDNPWNDPEVYLFYGPLIKI